MRAVQDHAHLREVQGVYASGASRREQKHRLHNQRCRKEENVQRTNTQQSRTSNNKQRNFAENRAQRKGTGDEVQSTGSHVTKIWAQLYTGRWNCYQDAIGQHGKTIEICKNWRRHSCRQRWHASIRMKKCRQQHWADTRTKRANRRTNSETDRQKHPEIDIAKRMGTPTEKQKLRTAATNRQDDSLGQEANAHTRKRAERNVRTSTV